VVVIVVPLTEYVPVMVTAKARSAAGQQFDEQDEVKAYVSTKSLNVLGEVKV